MSSERATSALNFEPSLQLSYLREQAERFFNNSAHCSEWVFIQDHLKANRNDDMGLLSGVKNEASYDFIYTFLSIM